MVVIITESMKIITILIIAAVLRVVSKRAVKELYENAK